MSDVVAGEDEAPTEGNVSDAVPDEVPVVVPVPVVPVPVPVVPVPALPESNTELPQSGRSSRGALRGPVLPSLIALGVVVASIAGTIAVAGKHRGTAAAAPAAPPPVRNAVWTVDGAHDAPSLGTLTGFWIGSDVVVRGAVDGLHAMKRADGTSAWDLPTPGGGDVCGMSPGLDGGIGIVVSQGTGKTSAVCSLVSAVDTATGKVLWTTPIGTPLGVADAGAADYAVSSGLAIIGSNREMVETGVVALDLHSGVKKWEHAAGCEHRPGAFAVTKTRVAIVEACQGSPTVRVLDAASGNPVPGVAGPVLGTQAGTHPQFLAAEPLAVVDDGGSPKSLMFGSGGPVAVADLSGLFSKLMSNGASRAQVSAGKDVLCAGGHSAVCWTAGGVALTLKGLPNEAADPHDVYPVVGTGDSARVVTTGAPGHPRASVCRVQADGSVVVEADLSQPVSDFLGKNGSAGSNYVYSDAKDLYMVVGNPAGATSVIDVRLG